MIDTSGPKYQYTGVLALEEFLWSSGDFLVVCGLVVRLQIGGFSGRIYF